MSKLLFSSFIFLSFLGTAHAQEYKYIYYLGKDFASVDSANALFIGKGYNENGLFALDCFDRTTGQRFMKIHFSDSSLSNMQGLFQSLYPDDKLESEGNYQNSLEQGVWTKWDSTGLKTDSLVFNMGKQTSSLNYSYYPNTNPKTALFHNLETHYKSEIFYNDSGIKEKEVRIEGDSAVAFYYHNGELNKRERLVSTEEKEAEFPGGMGAYKKFLEKNLNADILADHNAPDGSYTVIVKFVVGIDGFISEIIPETHFGYGLEEEAVRIIKLCPRWIPATQYGVPVVAYHRQPITFISQGNDQPAKHKRN